MNRKKKTPPPPTPNRPATILDNFHFVLNLFNLNYNIFLSSFFCVDVSILNLVNLIGLCDSNREIW